jgi:hypothetical protein
MQWKMHDWAFQSTLSVNRHVRDTIRQQLLSMALGRRVRCKIVNPLALACGVCLEFDSRPPSPKPSPHGEGFHVPSFSEEPATGSAR